MPWYYNTTPHVVRVRLADGSKFGFDSRKDIYVAKHLVSAEIIELVNSNTLKYRGSTGDAAEVEAVVLIIDPIIETDKIDDTSSDKLPDYDNVAVDTDDKIEEAEISEIEPEDDSSIVKRRWRRKKLLDIK